MKKNQSSPCSLDTHYPELPSSSSYWPLDLLFSPHHPRSPSETSRSGPDVNLSFHKSHNDTPTCFLSLLTQHWGRTWESELQFWAPTKCFCMCVCVSLPVCNMCVCVSTEVLCWGQTRAPAGHSPFGARMSVWPRGQGCNQTAGRLPRLLCCSRVDASVCVWRVYLYICVSV